MGDCDHEPHLVRRLGGGTQAHIYDVFQAFFLFCASLSSIPLTSPWYPLGIPLVSPWYPLGIPLVSPWYPSSQRTEPKPHPECWKRSHLCAQMSRPALSSGSGESFRIMSIGNRSLLIGSNIFSFAAQGPLLILPESYHPCSYFNFRDGDIMTEAQELHDQIMRSLISK